MESKSIPSKAIQKQLLSHVHMHKYPVSLLVCQSLSVPVTDYLGSYSESGHLGSHLSAQNEIPAVCA